MTILEIKIGGFGKHCNLEMNFKEGIHVICGGNESGKSTLAAFIRAMLYGLSGRGTQNERKKFRPWNRGVKYGGEMSFEHKGILYRVSAFFGESKREDNIILYNDTTGEIIPVEATKTIGEIVLEIPPETYDLTVYAAQLSSRPDLDNGNMDYLFDQLVKKSDRMKQTSSDLVVGKRLKNAMDAISSPRSEKGALDILQNRKSEIDTSVSKIYAMEAEAEQLRTEHNRLRAELKEIKDRHTAEKPDMGRITQAVETVSLHNEVKSCVTDINHCDEALADAVSRAKRIRRPSTVLYILLLSLLAICAAAVIFSGKLETISILQQFSFYQKAVQSKLTAYIFLGGIAGILTILYAIIVSSSGSGIKAQKEELFALEEELCALLNTEYLPGMKNHSDNRDTINAALEQHTQAYREAKNFLDNEGNKDSMDREYLASVEEYTQKIAYTKASADALNKTVDELGDSEELRAQSEELSLQIDSYKRRLECLSLAKSALEEAYQRWQADLGPVFGNEAGILLGRLTNGRYQDLRVARNFEITLRSTEGEMYHSLQYSGATVDQMYLALRLALVKIISAPESMLPVILDDPFVQYDMNRRRSAYDVMKRFSAENHAQIILTVCRNDGFPEEFSVTELPDV